MKLLGNYTENTEVNIEVITEVRLNQRERRIFARHAAGLCAAGELWVQLPFGGMVVADRAEFMQTGIVTLSHWTDKDQWYEGDEDELRVLENMLTDDLLAVQRLIGYRPPVAAPPSFSEMMAAS